MLYGTLACNAACMLIVETCVSGGFFGETVVLSFAFASRSKLVACSFFVYSTTTETTTLYLHIHRTASLTRVDRASHAPVTFGFESRKHSFSVRDPPHSSAQSEAEHIPQQQRNRTSVHSLGSFPRTLPHDERRTGRATRGTDSENGAADRAAEHPQQRAASHHA